MEEGWNEIGIHMQAPSAESVNDANYGPELVDHVRAAIQFAFPDANPASENPIFIIDNMKVIEAGDYVSFEDDPEQFCEWYNNEDECN